MAHLGVTKDVKMFAARDNQEKKDPMPANLANHDNRAETMTFRRRNLTTLTTIELL